MSVRASAWSCRGASCIYGTHGGKESIPALKTYGNNGANASDGLKAAIETALDADKALDIQTIDLRDQTALADYMIVATGTSTRQVGALAEKLERRLKDMGVSGIRIEGRETCNWVILDAGDIIVHLFRPEVREYYSIEKMWRTPQIVDTAQPRQRTV